MRDLMLVHVIMPKARRGSDAGGHGAAAATATAGRAGSHQEGQEGRGGARRRRTTRRRREKPIRRREGDRGAGQSGPKFKGTRHNVGFEVVDELAQRGVGRVRVGAGRRADREVAADRRRHGLAGQADDVHEPQRPGDRRAGCATSRSTSRDLLIVRRRGAAAARQAPGADARIGGRAQRVEDRSSRTSATISRGCGSASGARRRSSANLAGSRARAGSTRDEAAEVERMTTRAADAAEMFITSGIAAVMNAVQRRRSGNNRIVPAQPCGRRATLPPSWWPRSNGRMSTKETAEWQIVSTSSSTSFLPTATEAAGHRNPRAGRGRRVAHARADREHRQLGPQASWPTRSVTHKEGRLRPRDDQRHAAS